tara:strand:- start:674 stop:2179 length:1506 start_codon:yes stop_codon:yes gene_type:complete
MPSLLREYIRNKLIEQATNKASLIVVDIQPEYEGGATFDIGDLLRAATEYDRVLFLYNGEDTLGMIDEQSLRNYYFEKLDYDEEAYEELISVSEFFDKGYGFFRDVMDSGICFDRNSVIKIVKYMIDNNVQDIRDLDEEDVQSIGVSELLFDDLEDYGFWVPELQDVLPQWNGSDIAGGARNECLAEVEILAAAQGLSFRQVNEFIYEGDTRYTKGVLAEKYGKRQRIVNQESYSTMIQFHSEDDMFLPLGAKMMARVFGDLKQDTKGYHITNLNGVYGLLDIRGTSKQISVFTRGANADFIKGGITARGGVVVEVQGQQIASGMEDMFTLPEKGGRRNITLEYITKLVRDPSITDPMKKDLIQGLDEWLFKNAPDAGSGLEAWRSVAVKRDKSQLNSMVKHYLDTAEGVMAKYADTLRETVIDSIKLPSQNYHRLKMYDEIVMDKIQVKNVYIWKKYYQRRGMVNHPSDEEFKQFIQEMKDEGIDVFAATTQEIIDMVDK